MEFPRVARRSLRLSAGPLLVLAFVGPWIAGCGSGGRHPITTQIVPYTPEQLVVRDAAKDARYKLRTGDRLSVAFKYETDLDVENVLVLPDGFIALKGLSDPVRAAGQTVEDLDKILETAYGAEYRNPDLAVLVIDITAPEIYVLGAVKQPGIYKLPEHGRGVLQAVAMAGGYTQDAKPSQTVIMRATDEGFLMRQFDLSDLAKNQITSLEVLDMEPYDIVFVPETSLSDFAHVTTLVFGSVVKISGFFWDVYALTNLGKIQTILR